MPRFSYSFLFLSGIALTVAAFFHPITAFTQDLGRHLLTGEIILKTHFVPKINLFSYTYPNFPFINHHWFSEVLFFLINKSFGSNGLLIVSTFVVTLSVITVIQSTIKRNARFLSIFIAIIFYAHILSDRTDIRPEIFSYLFLSLYLLILYKYKESFTKLIYAIPLLQLLWSNTHIYFPIGIAVLGLFLVDNVFENRTLLSSKNLSMSRSTKHLFIVLFLSTLATCINPNGIQGALYPFTVFNNYGYSIEENQNIFFIWNYSHKPAIPYILFTLVVIFGSFIFSYKKIKRVDFLLTVFLSYLAISAVRNFPLYAIGTFGIFSYYLSHLLSEPLNKFNKNYSVYIAYKALVIILFLAVLIWQFSDISKTRGLGFGEYAGAKPAVDYLIKEHIEGPIYNNFDIGSYLEYRLYPAEKVYIDGRPEAYPATFFQQKYIPSQTSENIFKEEDKKYHFNTIFFSHGDQTPWAQMFLGWIYKSKDWRLIYLDEFSIIMVKNTEQNKNLITNADLEQNENKNPLSLLRIALFYNKIGDNKKAAEFYKKVLDVDPNNCYALYALITQSMTTQEESNALELRFNETCR